MHMRGVERRKYTHLYLSIAYYYRYDFKKRKKGEEDETRRTSHMSESFLFCSIECIKTNRFVQAYNQVDLLLLLLFSLLLLELDLTDFRELRSRKCPLKFTIQILFSLVKVHRPC